MKIDRDSPGYRFFLKMEEAWVEGGGDGLSFRGKVAAMAEEPGHPDAANTMRELVDFLGREAIEEAIELYQKYMP